MNGFDGSLFGGLTANSQFLDFFHGSAVGEWQAINSAMYQIGGISALPFVGPAIDTWGRKVGMAIGAWLIIIGCIINGTTLYNPGDIGQLQGGRFVLGFGVAIVSAAGPIYVVETAHPAWRGICTAYCNTFWFTGSILASGAVRGAIVLSGNISWQIPVWLQVSSSFLLIAFASAADCCRWCSPGLSRSSSGSFLRARDGCSYTTSEKNPNRRSQHGTVTEIRNLHG